MILISETCYDGCMTMRFPLLRTVLIALFIAVLSLGASQNGWGVLALPALFIFLPFVYLLPSGTNGVLSLLLGLSLLFCVSFSVVYLISALANPRCRDRPWIIGCAFVLVLYLVLYIVSLVTLFILLKRYGAGFMP